jgi:predicted aminopeptidase
VCWRWKRYRVIDKPVVRSSLWVWVFVSPFLVSCYSIRVAVEYTKSYASRRSVEEVLQDAAVSESTKTKLRSVEKIITYANLQGLHTQGAYRYFIADKKDVVSYLLEVAYPDRLESVTWWFPIVGSVPYKGYFSKKERDEVAAQYQKEGYDVYVTGVGAFSSLGWLEDPIYEPMLHDSFASLCNLFFHELTHRTLWVSDQVPFNEALATYVGDVLTRAYLDVLRMEKEKTEYLQGGEDQKQFFAWLSRLNERLKILYETPALSPAGLRAEKKKVFDLFVSKEKPLFKSVDFVGKKEWNNARVLANHLYSPDLERFSRAHQCLPDPHVGFFLTALSKQVKKTADPFEALDQLCRPKTEVTHDPNHPA